MVVRLLWLSGRALAAQARGVLSLTPGDCRPFHFPIFLPHNIYFQLEVRYFQHYIALFPGPAQLSIARSTESRKVWYLSSCECDVIGKWSSSIFVFVQPTTPLILGVYDSHTVHVYKQTWWEYKTPFFAGLSF